MKKRIVSLLMALALCLSLLPTAALAEGAVPPAEETPVQQESVPQQDEEQAEQAPAEPEEDAPVEDAEEEEIPEEQEESEEPEEPVQDAPVAAVQAMENGIAVQTNGHNSHYLCGGDTCNGGSHGQETDETAFAKEIKQVGGTLYIDNSKWTVNSSGNYVLDSGTYYLSGDIKPNAPIHLNGSVTLCLNGHSITANHAGDVITVKSGVTFTLTDCEGTGEITHASTADNGGGMYVLGTFNMYGGSITGNEADYQGGGMLVNSGTFKMFGGSITGNKASGRGGGVSVTGSSALFTMTGGSITGNNADIGGGVYVSNGTFTMSGGTIGGTGTGEANTDVHGGGGVYVDSGTFTMNDGSITGNSSKSAGGGVYDFGTFNMSGGSITGNNAAGTGGGVYVGSNGTLTMSGGTIGGTGTNEANKAGYGGGVYVNSSEFIMTGGSITGNSSTSSGGGVYVYSGNFTVSGQVNITDNTRVNNSTNNNVYLPEDKTITIGNGGLPKGAKLGVTLSSYYGDNVFTSGWGANMGDKSPSDYFIFDAGTKKFVLDNGELKLRNAHDDHYLCGGDTCTEVGHDKETGMTNFTAWTKKNSLPNADGNYYLTEDVTLSSTWEIKESVKNVVLCLNGHTIKMTGDNDVINVYWGKKLTLTDCAPEGKDGTVTHEDGKTGRGVFVSAGSTFTLYGGSITGNETANGYGGGGVYVDNGTFTMNGGSITDNNASGGGVYVYTNGTFNMCGGSITDNNAGNGGGVYVYGGTFNMSGGSITGNNATRGSGGGGGVYVNGGKFEMTDGSITDNNADYYGGGVYVTNNGSFTMSASDNGQNFPSITGNKATSGNGGGVYVMGSNSTFTMTGGSITGNTATSGNGGGVYVNLSRFTMKDTASVSGNTAQKYGGGVYVAGTFTMIGGTIGGTKTGEANTAAYGGGVYVDGATFDMTGGSISSNNAGGDGDGGGVYVNGQFTVSGKVNITGNTKSGKDNNVYLFAGKTITIGTGGLTTGASIGVTTAVAPTDTVPVTIATGAKDGVDYSKIFTPDAGANYSITQKDSSVYLALHVHTWTYALKEGTTDTITAACKDCAANGGRDFSGGSVTIKAPADLTYSGSDKTATVDSSSWLGDNVAVTYSPSTPKDAGTYTASITVEGADGVTATAVSGEYTIKPATITITPTDGLCKEYGQADPELTYTATGVQNGETPAFTGSLSRSKQGADNGEGVGQYEIFKSDLKLADSGSFKAGNYELVFVSGKYFTIDKATYTGTKESSVNAIINPKGTDVYVTLPELPEGASYGKVTMDNTSTDKNGNPQANIFGSGSGTIENDTLKLNVQSGTAGLTAHVRVAVTGAKNYQDYEIDITVTTIAKIIATVNVKAPSGVSCGDTITLTPSMTGESGTNGTWSWTYDSNSFQFAESNANTGVLKIKAIKAGEATITFTYTSSTHQGSASVTFTVGKKILTKDDLTGIPDKLTKVYDGANKHTETVTLGLTNSAKINENEQAQINISKDDITYAQSNAGTTTATLSLKNVDLGPNYGFSVESITVNAEITKATPSYTVPADLSATYGQTLKDVTLPSGWSWKNSGESVGDATENSAATFRAVFTPADTDNYKTVETDVEVKVNKAPGRNLGTIVLEQPYTDKTEHTQALVWTQLPGGQQWTYSGEVSRTIAKNDLAVGGSTLTYQVTDGKVNEVITFTIRAMCNNYEDYTYTVTLNIVDRVNQTNFKFVEATKTVTYGDEDFTVTAADQADGSVVTYASSDIKIATVDEDGKVTIKGVGTTTITATASATDDYKEATATYTLTVSPRAITVTADNKTMTVNGKLPEFTVSYGNLPAGVKAEDIFGTLPTASTAADGKTVGEFDIAVTEGSLKDASKSNYTVEIVKGTLTVTKQSGGYYYYTPTAGGTTDANKSPRTGDAGLLVYGLTALSSYTGTALLLRRKRKD